VDRDHWQRRIAALDPDVDFAEIDPVMAAYEVPWDMTQSLRLALLLGFYLRPLRPLLDGYSVEALGTFPG
jgi:hypothetical protein